VPDSNRLAARYHQPVPFSDNARKSTFVYLGLTAGVLALVGAVAYEWHQERQVAAKGKGTALAKAAPRESTPRAAPVAEEPAAPVPVVTERSKSLAAAVQPPAAVAPEKPKAVAPEKPKAVAPEKPKAVALEKPAAVASAPIAAQPEKPRIVAGSHRLVVRTEGEAWIEIKDAADRMLVSSLNPPGSERVVRGKPPYSLVIGNASNVRVFYDDKPIDLAPHTRQDVARVTVP